MRRRIFLVLFLLTSCFFGGWRWGKNGTGPAHDSGIFLFGLRQILRGDGAGVCLFFFLFDFVLLTGLLTLGWLRPAASLLTLPALPVLAGLAGANCALLPGGAVPLLALWEVLILSSLTASAFFSVERAVYRLSCPQWDSTDAAMLKRELLLVSATLLLGAAFLLLLRKTAYFGYFASLL